MKTWRTQKFHNICVLKCVFIDLRYKKWNITLCLLYQIVHNRMKTLRKYLYNLIMRIIILVYSYIIEGLVEPSYRVIINDVDAVMSSLLLV